VTINEEQLILCHPAARLGPESLPMVCSGWIRCVPFPPMKTCAALLLLIAATLPGRAPVRQDHYFGVSLNPRPLRGHWRA